MKIHCIADIHGHFHKFKPEHFPKCDVLVIAGDITNAGVMRPEEIQRAYVWLADIVEYTPKCKARFIIPGNHDIGIDEFKAPGFTDLAYKTKIVDGVSFHGVPLCVAYNMPELATTWSHTTINPEAEAAAFDFEPVDVVVSHSPPLGMCDLTASGDHAGSPALSRYITDHRPQLVVCGHIHEALGATRIGETTVINTAMRGCEFEVRKRQAWKTRSR